MNVLFALAFVLMAAMAYFFFRNPDLSFMSYVLMLPFVYSPFFILFRVTFFFEDCSPAVDSFTGAVHSMQNEYIVPV